MVLLPFISCITPQNNYNIRINITSKVDILVARYYKRYFGGKVFVAFFVVYLSMSKITLSPGIPNFGNCYAVFFQQFCRASCELVYVCAIKNFYYGMPLFERL